MTLKDTILLELHHHPKQYISGESLASKFAVSRTAVWKAVQQLKKSGYPINAVPHKGYQLTQLTDILDTKLIQSLLTHDAQHFEIDYYETIDSTNNKAKEYISSGARTPKVIIANEQTAGRGRVGRQFHSPTTSGLYMSICFFPTQSFSELTLLTSASAVAVYRAVKNITQQSLQIKWVNDLFLNSKKIAGILTEAVTDLESRHVAGLVVGIGINITVDKQTTPQELTNIVGGLYDTPNPSFTRNQLVAEIINQWQAIVQQLPDRAFLTDYREQSCVLNQTVTVLQADETYEATALAIDEQGGLVIERLDGTQTTLFYGEISIRPLDSPALSH